MEAGRRLNQRTHRLPPGLHPHPLSRVNGVDSVDDVAEGMGATKLAGFVDCASATAIESTRNLYITIPLQSMEHGSSFSSLL